MPNPRLLAVPLLLCLAVACGGEDVPQVTTTYPGGLWTNPNDTRAPKGALAVADDVYEMAPDVLSPARGMSLSATISGTITAAVEFGGYTIVHHSTGTISRQTTAGNDTAWTAYSGTYAKPSGATRPLFWKHAGSLFVLTSAGTYELDSATGTWRLTGAPRGLDGSATLARTSSTTGWMVPNGQAAYRVLWGYKNGNKRVQLGAPSGRFLVKNPANVSATTAQVAKANGSTTVTVTGPTHGFVTGEYVDVTLGGAETWFAAGTFQVTVTNSTTFTYVDAVNNTSGGPVNPGAAVTYGFTRNVTLSIPIPSGITTSNFCQVYRSAESPAATTEPMDDDGLVYECFPTNVDITNGSLSISDVTPDNLRGAELYTSLEGILASKDRPPLANTQGRWRDVTFYGDTTQTQRIALQALSITGWEPAGGVAPRLDIGDAQFFPSTSEDTSGPYLFKVYTTGTTAQNIADTVRSLVRVINGTQAANNYRAWYTSNDADVPGMFIIEALTTTASAFNVVATDFPATAFAPNLQTVIQSAVGDTSRAGTTVTVNTRAAHGFVAGQTVTLAGDPNADPNFANGVKTIATVPTTTRFTYTEAGAATTNAEVLGFTTIGTTPSTADARTNRVYFSNPGEPWAVPPGQYFDVGSTSDTVSAITPIPDRLIVWTDNGTYQVTGTYPNFAVSELDLTVSIAAADSAKAFNGSAYALTNKGLVAVSDGARIVSLPIDDTLRSYYVNNRSNYGKSFAVPYESQNMLFVWVASSAAQPSQAFVFHGGSEKFTRLTRAGNIAYVRPSTDKLLLGDTSGRVWTERKGMTADDMSDTPTATYSVAVTPVSATQVTVDDPTGLSIGDRFTTDVGAHSAIITNISDTTLTIESNPDMYAAGPDTFSTVEKRILSVIEPIPFMPAGTGGQASVTDGSLDFKLLGFGRVWMQYATNLASTLSTAEAVGPPDFTPPNGPAEVRFALPITHQTATRFRVRFSAGEVARTFSWQGMSLNYSNVQQTIGR